MSTALRQKFIDHMTVRRLSPKTQESYTNAVAGLAAYYRKAPDTFSDDQIQAYLLYLIKERRLAWNSCNVVFSGLRCFYGEVLKWEQTRFSIPPRPLKKQLPMLLSVEQVQRLFDATRNPKHRTLLMAIDGAGLRVSEVVNLKPGHIESSRMMIRVEQGKGMKDRHTLLPKRLLDELRSYCAVYRPAAATVTVPNAARLPKNDGSMPEGSNCCQPAISIFRDPTRQCSLAFFPRGAI